ncbi:type II toxin-antitoxin system Phd/YefM family antitoxin [Arthrobacter dokdonensis]|uniref:type II toxin-antitoxin system Phd/YefM family antitoxin n=1 Tax=Arthrobacter dokdonellae TaxID=2211210 RepID=UPI000DE586E8|nr:type II toxin-antitoxin system prevent-host-death family antitoxin [Arthrobacter dokdonellae]
MGSSEPQAESLSQRELRNESGRVLRAVSEGHSFVLTNSGVPVGRIVPLDAPAAALPIARPARREGGWRALDIERKTSERGLAATLDDLRGDRL